MRYRLGLGLALICCTSLATGAFALEAARAVEPVPPPPSAPARAATQNTRTAQALPAQQPDAPVKPVASEQATGPAPASPATDAPGTKPGATPDVPSVKPAPIPVAISQDTRPTLDASTFINTMRAASAYLRIVQEGGWPSLPDGTVLKAGDKGPLVATLRQRLAIEGDLAKEDGSSQTFDSDLAAAVKRFQARHGLPETGAVRARTLEALNVPAATRHRQLAASAQRLMASSFPFGERHVIVNIPSAAVEAIENGQVVRRYVAVVGKSDRPSPTVETRITAVNLNPTWTVPVSLIRKDIIPHVRKDASYLAKMKIRILDGKGQEVDP